MIRLILIYIISWFTSPRLIYKTTWKLICKWVSVIWGSREGVYERRFSTNISLFCKYVTCECLYCCFWWVLVWYLWLGWGREDERVRPGVPQNLWPLCDRPNKCQDLSCYLSASLSLSEKIKEDIYCKLCIHKTTRKIFTGFSEAYHSRMSSISAYVLSLLAIQCSTARESTVVLMVEIF